MFATRPPPVHSLTSRQASGALNILFCGSDAFSIVSLRALAAARRQKPQLIDTLHVVHRPAKPAGRGLKQLRQVPIQNAAAELSLPTSTLDTFAGWTPPTSFDLIIAVSFGLFIPSRILSRAKFGGLNVHPSLLPDLNGPAPIQHAIWKRRTHTGVSIQTLHPRHFDQGIVLAQTAAPGIEIPNRMTAKHLESQLATLGADMLVHVLQSRKYAPPLKEVGWYMRSNRPTEHAPKITKQDRFIDLRTSSLTDILAVQDALGDPWCLLPDGERVILHSVVDSGRIDPTPDRTPGIWIEEQNHCPVIRDVNGQIGMIIESTIAGGRRRDGNAALVRKLTQNCLLG